jgi:hypothetical protein
VQCKVQVFSDVGSRGPLTYARSGDSTSKCCHDNGNIIIVIIKFFSGFKEGCCSCSLLNYSNSPSHTSVPTFRNVSLSCLGPRIQRVFGFFLAPPSWGPPV